jgi:GNAT superfamily N-acetyltransferase
MASETRTTEDDVTWQLRPARLAADADAVVALMGDYLAWANGRLREEYGLDESPTDPASRRDSLPTYLPPTGSLIVVEHGSDLIGMGALRTIAPEVVEVKRMYVDPRWQGHHLGSALLDRLLQEAGETLGAKTVRLDTCGFMSSAQRLYRSRGFVERAPYEGTEIPVHLQQYWRFFERDL